MVKSKYSRNLPRVPSMPQHPCRMAIRVQQERPSRSSSHNMRAIASCGPHTAPCSRITERFSPCDHHDRKRLWCAKASCINSIRHRMLYDGNSSHINAKLLQASSGYVRILRSLNRFMSGKQANNYDSRVLGSQKQLQAAQEGIM